MKKKKLSLDALKVRSFVTGVKAKDSKTIKGLGETFASRECIVTEVNCNHTNGCGYGSIACSIGGTCEWDSFYCGSGDTCAAPCISNTEPPDTYEQC